MNISGVSFVDDIPDEVRKYILIHELGHYYGLCHVDGLDRIMVTGQSSQGDKLTWGTIPNTLIHGGPRFTHSEAKQAWDFILANFREECFVPRVIITWTQKLNIDILDTRGLFIWTAVLARYLPNVYDLFSR